MNFFVPTVQFVLHRARPTGDSNDALLTRSRALEATLLNYLRRKELNRSARVKIRRHEQHFETVRLIVRPAGTVHYNPAPEDVPGLVEKAMTRTRTES